MSLVLQSSGGGQITVQEPTTASNFTQTLPAATGTVMVSGNQPAFSVALSGNQSVSSATATKITFNSEEFDTSNAFDSTTNYRFTPQIAGYYQINAASLYGSNSTSSFIIIYKNGSEYKRGTQVIASSSNAGNQVSSLVYLNGSSDFIEIYSFQSSGGSLNLQGASAFTWCNGILVRTA